SRGDPVHDLLQRHQIRRQRGGRRQSRTGHPNPSPYVSTESNGCINSSGGHRHTTPANSKLWTSPPHQSPTWKTVPLEGPLTGAWGRGSTGPSLQTTTHHTAAAIPMTVRPPAVPSAAATGSAPSRNRSPAGAARMRLRGP